MGIEPQGFIGSFWKDFNTLDLDVLADALHHNRTVLVDREGFILVGRLLQQRL